MRILLHIGAPKTGSSALQSAFVINRDALIERGIFYPCSHTDANAAAGNPISGNAIPLANFFNPELSVPAEEWDFDACAATLDQARGAGCSTVLYSSEYMSCFLSERMNDFLTRTSSFSSGVEIVYFVRDIAGHAMSCYQQHSKGGRFSGTFAAYVERSYRPPFSSHIERSIAAVGRAHVTVLGFDELRKSLFPSMIEAVGHASDGLPDAPEVNCSSGGTAPSDGERTAIAARWSNEIHRVNEILGRKVLSALAANLLALLEFFASIAPDACL